MNAAALTRIGAGFEALIARLAGFERRLLLGVLAALVAFAAFEAWVLVLRAPLAEYRSLEGVRLAAQAVAQPDGLEAEIERLTQRGAAHERELAAAAAGKRDEEAVFTLIETLGDLAVRHGIVLGRVDPTPRAAVAGFDERGFTVEARGDYRSLHRWLAEARLALAPLVVAELALRSADGGPRVVLAARLASYRVAAATTAASGAAR